MQNESGASATKFSDFRVTLLDKAPTVALVSCQVGGVIWLSGMRVQEGSRGRFLAMPVRKSESGDYHDIFFPASRVVREELQMAALKAYEEALARGRERQLA